MPFLLPSSPFLLLRTLGFGHLRLWLCACPIHNICASVLISLCLCHLCLSSIKCSFMYSSMCPVQLYRVKENSHSDNIHPHHILHYLVAFSHEKTSMIFSPFFQLLCIISFLFCFVAWFYYPTLWIFFISYWPVKFFHISPSLTFLTRMKNMSLCNDLH